MTGGKSGKKVEGKLCLLCGNTDNLTLHHLKHETRPKKEREELGIILHNGETVPLCRTCHVKIEFLKDKRDTLRGLAKGITQAKQSISTLMREEFYYMMDDEEVRVPGDSSNG